MYDMHGMRVDNDFVEESLLVSGVLGQSSSI